MTLERVASLTSKAGCVVLIAAFSFGVATRAQAFEASEQQRQACTPDAFRLCSAEIPDVARVTACMIANKARLSPACRAVFDTARHGRVDHRHRYWARRARAHYARYDRHHRWSRYAYYHRHHAHHWVLTHR